LARARPAGQQDESMQQRVQIFGNGVVFTGVRDHPWAQAVAVRGADVLGVGDLADLREVWPDAEEVDLAGGTLLPGLIDAHNHFLGTGESLASLDLRYPVVDSAEALLRVARDAAAAAAPGETIVGFGFDNGKYQLPTLAELDAACGDHPLRFFHTSGHNVLVNSLVLARAGIDDQAPDPVGGRFVRDTDGRLTGLCLDAASGAVVQTEVDIGSHGPNFHTSASLDDLVGAVDRASRAFRAAGLTCVADAQVTSRELRGYREARSRGVLGIRCVCMPLSHQIDEFAALGLVGPFGDDHLSIGHLKIYADGSLTGGTAAFSTGLGVKGQQASYFHEPEQLVALIERASKQGWRVGVHAQGNEAISYALTGFEHAMASSPRADARPRIEHAGVPTASGVERMARLGVIAVNQPSYLFDYGDEYAESLGGLVEDMQPWRDELEAGVRVVISSDSDVSSYRPLTTIAHAMRRRTMSGRVLGERHRLTLDEALFAHTIDAAYAIGLEHRIGSLEPGKAADLTWLASDLRAVAAEGVADAEIVTTFIDGVAPPSFDGPG
jgi:predicted amidohydrolase YtcJ